MALSSRVRRVEGGGVRVRLSARERDVLRSLPEQLRGIVTGRTGPQDVHERLFPAAYAETDLQAEFADLMGDELARERSELLDRFSASIEGGTLRRSTWTATLDADEAHAWLTVVNDARLVLAGLEGIVDESVWDAGPDPSNPRSLLLYYLGWLEEEFVGALMGSLPD